MKDGAKVFYVFFLISFLSLTALFGFVGREIAVSKFPAFFKRQASNRAVAALLRERLSNLGPVGVASPMQAKQRKMFWITDTSSQRGVPLRLLESPEIFRAVGSSRVDLQACKLEYSIVSPK